ncbi:MAG: hypothetical protein AAGC57_18350 [Pseudomonadota bacterium]
MFRICLLATALLAGCAQVTAVRVTDTNPSPEGLPLYGHKPILVVTATEARVQIIPNLNERYALRIQAFLAKNHTTATFNANGTLASVDANLDTTDILGLFEKALDKIPVAPAASGGARSGGAVQIYEFVFNDDGTLSLRQLGGAEVRAVTGTASSADAGAGISGGGISGDGSVQPVED